MATETLKVVKQTCKTILFEEFRKDEDADTLFEMLDSYDDPTTANFEQELQKLEVHSFDEFVLKFKPKIYEICQNIDGLPHFFYTTDERQAKLYNAVEQDIVDSTFYRMLEKMYEEKGTSGQSNLEFNDADILNMLMPQQEIQDARDTKRKLVKNTQRFMLAQAKGESTDSYGTQINKCIEKIEKKFRQSKLGLLPLAIGDKKEKIQLLSEAIANIPEVTSGEAVLLPAGQVEFNADGDLVVVSRPPVSPDNDVNELPVSNTLLLSSPEEVRNKLVKLIEKRYDAYEKRQGISTEPDQPNFTKSLILDTYTPSRTVAPENQLMLIDEAEDLKASYEIKLQQYETVYSQAKESFIKEMFTVCEKLLSVKIFFDHATLNGKFPAGLIVANCKAPKLMESSVKQKFEAFLDHRGKDQVEKKVWFAILPGVSEGESNGTLSFDPFGDEDSEQRMNNHSSDTISMSNLKSILKPLGDSRIFTVFSFKGDPKTGFDSLGVEYVRELKEEKFKDFNDINATLAYPNFNLMRERSINVVDNDAVGRIKIPGIFIDACYVAAGLIVGSQQIEYIESKLKTSQGSVNKNEVCVRFNIEDHKTKLLTKFNLESATNMSGKTKKLITEDMFGFVFASDAIIDEKNEAIKNTYVLCARTLCKEKGQYLPIYKTLTRNFVYAYLNKLPDKKETTLKGFVNNIAGDWKNEHKNKMQENCVNLILREGEEIKYDENEHKISINFGEEPLYLEDIKVDI